MLITGIDLAHSGDVTMAYARAVVGKGSRKKPKAGDVFALTLDSGVVIHGAVGASEKSPEHLGLPHTLILYFFRGLPPGNVTAESLLMDLQVTTLDAFQQGYLVPAPGHVEPLVQHPLCTAGGKWINERIQEIEAPERPPWGVFEWVSLPLLVDRVNVALGEYLDGVPPPPSELDLRSMRVRPDVMRRKGWWL